MKKILDIRQTKERGATMVEYALVVALMMTVVIVGATKFADRMHKSASKIGDTTHDITTTTDRIVGIARADQDTQDIDSNSSIISLRCRAKFGNPNGCEMIDGRLQLRGEKTDEQGNTTPASQRSKNPCCYMIEGSCSYIDANGQPQTVQCTKEDGGCPGVTCP